MKRKLFAYALLFLALSSCGKQDSDQVADAQACLDQSTSTTALACLNQLGSVQGASAELVRCSAYFIAQDFSNPSRIAQVASALNNNQNIANASYAAIGFLAFTKSSPSTQNLVDVTTAYGHCLSSNSKGLILMASMARIATSLAAIGPTIVTNCGTNINTSTCVTSVQSAACSAVGNTSLESALGQAALSAYSASCVGQPANSVCQQFANAINGSTNPTTVGTSLATTVCSGN